MVRLTSPRSRMLLAVSLALLLACAAVAVHAQTEAPAANSTASTGVHQETEDEKQLEEAENVSAHPFLESQHKATQQRSDDARCACCAGRGAHFEPTADALRIELTIKAH